LKLRFLHASKFSEVTDVFPGFPRTILMMRPLVVSRKLALRMNSDRGDYLVYEVGSKEN
jgi:hypothetical protein